MAVEFTEEEGRGLAAAGVAGSLAAEEDYGAVGAGAGCEGGGVGEGEIGERGCRVGD